MLEYLIDPTQIRPMPPSKKCAYFEMSTVLLADLLLLPEGVRIIGIRERYDREVVEIKVEGPGLPEVEPGCSIPRVNPQYKHRNHPIPEFDSWHYKE